MNIGVYVENYRRGGVDRIIADTITHWPRSGDRFVVFVNDTHEGRAALERELTEAEVVAYPSPRGMRRSNPSLLRRLAYESSGCFLAMSREIERVRGYIRDHGLKALIVHNGGWPGARSTRSAALAARRAGIPCFLVIHNFAARKHWAMRIQEAWIEKRLRWAGVRLVTVSNAASASLRSATALPAPVMIYNGVRDTTTEARASEPGRANLDISGDAFVALVAGTLEARRGHLLLLEAMRRVVDVVPSAVLLIAGSGTDEERRRLQARVVELDLSERVRFLGFQENVISLMAAADVVVNPVQDFESFGLVAVEAMSVGKPVIATDVGGNVEVVVDGVTGFLVAKDDPGEMAGRILELARDPDLGRRLGIAGRSRYTERFAASEMAAGYARLLAGVEGPA